MAVAGSPRNNAGNMRRRFHDCPGSEHSAREPLRHAVHRFPIGYQAPLPVIAFTPPLPVALRRESSTIRAIRGRFKGNDVRLVHGERRLRMSDSWKVCILFNEFVIYSRN